ncbi:MAG: ornithine cyclodeaminase family protein [Dehalococcoidia bacterium]
MTAPRYLDAAAIVAALSPAAAVDAVTAALRAGFDPASDIPRSVAHTGRGHFLLMPSEVGGHAGVKVATVAPDNPVAGLPRIQASYLLFDAATLTLQAILDGTALTTLRTPAVSLAATRPALERIREPARVVVFGAGPQAIGHVGTLAAVLGHLDAVTFVVRRPDRAGAASRERGTVVRTDSEDAAAALADAHVVVCATTARTPLFPGDAVPPDAVVIAVGSHEPDARELAGALLRRATVIVEDVDTALREAGDIIQAVHDEALDTSTLIPMRQIVTGATPLPTGRPVVFKSVGMSWQDLVVATAVVAAGPP